MTKQTRITKYEEELFLGISNCRHRPLLITYAQFYYGLHMVPQIIDPKWVAYRAIIHNAVNCRKLNADQASERADTVFELCFPKVKPFF